MVLLTAFMFLGFLCLPGGSDAAEVSSSILENIRGSEPPSVPRMRVADTLQKLSRNLILDRTRGEKDVAIFQKAAPAVVLVLVGKESTGSGVLITADGQVLTNWHVVGSSPRAVVVLKPKDTAELRKELAFAATVEKVDQIADLALLKITNPPPSLASLGLGRASLLEVGQDVHAIGHPRGEVWTYTKGLISQIRANYEWKAESGISHRANIIQTQTPINPGNSGGPLIDDGGRLVGINSFKGSGEGLNYAISVDSVREFLLREGSRRAPQTQTQARPELKCSETFDIGKRGWNNIIGCYQDSASPPPDVWFIFRARTKNPAYVAMDSDTSGKASKIDLVKRNVDPDWKVTELFVDSDCDGTVDLVEKYMGNERISSRLPPTNLRMVSLAKELHQALTTGDIPYRNFKVCQ
jgi:hypothetical protein